MGDQQLPEPAFSADYQVEIDAFMLYIGDAEREADMTEVCGKERRLHGPCVAEFGMPCGAGVDELPQGRQGRLHGRFCHTGDGAVRGGSCLGAHLRREPRRIGYMLKATELSESPALWALTKRNGSYQLLWQQGKSPKRRTISKHLRCSAGRALADCAVPAVLSMQGRTPRATTSRNAMYRSRRVR
jgi:hypothetical protein